MTELRTEICVVGAGPAGLAAAAAAAERGAEVTLIESEPRPGGQFWRHGPHGPDVDLHHDLATFDRLIRALASPAIDRRCGHRVWSISDRTTVHADHDGHEVTVRADRLVLAPGAYDRQLPFPGWTLPGVITAGAAQALLKQHGVLAGRRVLVAGTGPFLLPVATALATRGATVVGVVEANSARRWRHHLGAVRVSKVREGAGYAARLAAHRVPVQPRSVVLAAHGGSALEAATIARLDGSGRVREGTRRTIAVDTLAVGWGFTPQLELPVAAGCELIVLGDQAFVRVDDHQRSTVPEVYVAGEATGIGGAQLAVIEGEIAGASAAGAGADDTARLRASAARHRAFAAALGAVYPVPPGWADRLTADTVVCRCEEVSVADVRAAADLGARDLRTGKLLSRAGMGWCQGRVCGYATACLIAEATGTPADPTQGHERPVATPVPLGLIAGTDEGEQP